MLDTLKKALAERILNAELDHHCGRARRRMQHNHRNGHSHN
jgi:transposase-like protein